MNWEGITSALLLAFGFGCLFALFILPVGVAVVLVDAFATYMGVKP